MGCCDPCYLQHKPSTGVQQVCELSSREICQHQLPESWRVAEAKQGDEDGLWAIKGKRLLVV